MRYVMTLSLVLAVLLLSSVAFAGSTFVVNGLPDAAINNLYLSESRTNNWEEDVLGNDILYPGEGITIDFYGGGCWWDMLAIDTYGNQVEWYNLNLCGVGNITLYPGGQAQLQ